MVGRPSTSKPELPEASSLRATWAVVVLPACYYTLYMCYGTVTVLHVVLYGLPTAFSPQGRHTACTMHLIVQAATGWGVLSSIGMYLPAQLVEGRGIKQDGTNSYVLPHGAVSCNMLHSGWSPPSCSFLQPYKSQGYDKIAHDSRSRIKTTAASAMVGMERKAICFSTTGCTPALCIAGVCFSGDGRMP